MRKYPVQVNGYAPRTITRVILLDELTAGWEPDLQFIVRVENLSELRKLKSVIDAGLANLAPLISNPDIFNDWDGAAILDEAYGLQKGDVVAIGGTSVDAHVLFRENDQHHTVFLTNRCNSNCLMCSQPPTPDDDSWLVNEAYQVAVHMGVSPISLGFSGGEPLLLGERLRETLDTFISRHPTTQFELLSNGRLFANKELANQLLMNLENKVTWMIPLYGHADFLHDFIVQSHGAFEETLAGLLNLHASNQAIQLRTVLIQPVLEHLPIFCEFIGKNLPFVHEVALMACEPIGFALANRKLTDIDLRDWKDQLTESIKVLERLQINVILMNTPLCAIPEELWIYARKSISDWKRKFEPECDECLVKNDCAGLFSWHKKDITMMQVNKIQGVVSV